MLSPYKGDFRVTSPQQSARTLNGITKPHNGIDIVGVDKNIYAVTSGKVVISSMIDRSTGNAAWQFGNRITILDQNGKYVMYNHLAKRLVFTGQTVKAGQLIGVEGWTGYVVPQGTRGSHLHFEVRDRLGTGFKNFSAAEYLGIPNEVHKYVVASKPDNTISETVETNCEIRKGDKVEVTNVTTINGITRGKTYTGGTFVVYYKEYDVISLSSDRVIIGVGSTITAAVKKSDLKKIN